MALTAALVDRARLVRLEPLPERVMGKTRHAPVREEWFKCRLELPAAPETQEAPPWSKRRVVRTPTLMFGIRDVKGGPLVLSVEDRVEVVSKQLGSSEWEIISAPEPFRKKRKVIGGQVTLRRVEALERAVA